MQNILVSDDAGEVEEDPGEEVEEDSEEETEGDLTGPEEDAAEMSTPENLDSISDPIILRQKIREARGVHQSNSK